ncbi:MAG: hypothetical protein KA072_02180 [Thermoanaerobaculaceae bacterium]|nr:hypothetical protein [Thermoanaerobaculaceae bacterium]MDI9621564.1 hypothetical protein [Acidobacteriota bacterium]
MSDIEIHIKSGTFSYDAAFPMGDEAAAKDAKEWATFILDRAAGTPSSTTKPAPRKTKKVAATATASPFGAASATEEDS